MTQTNDLMETARVAVVGHSWREAYDLLSPVTTDLADEGLKLLAEAAWWTGRRADGGADDDG